MEAEKCQESEKSNGRPTSPRALAFSVKSAASPPSCHPATSCLCPQDGWGGGHGVDEGGQMGRVPVSHVGWSDRIISRRKLYFAVAHVQTINLFLWPFKTVPVFLAITFAMHGGSFELLSLQSILFRDPKVHISKLTQIYQI